MNNESSDERAPVFSEGFVVPISGLLALLFAVMAGMTVFPALSGSPGDIALPIIFGLASLLCFRIRRRASESSAD